VFNKLKLKSKSFAGDDMQNIRAFLEETANENTALKKRSEINESFLRNVTIADFLKRGARTTSDSSDMFISRSYDFYMVTLYTFDDLSGIFFEKEQSDSAENYVLAKTVLLNILSEQFELFCDVISLEIDGLLCIILNIGKLDDSEQILETIAETKDLVLEQFNIDFSAMISSVHKDIHSLPNCYAETLSCMEYLYDGRNKIIRYSDLKAKKKSKYYYPLEKEAQLLNYLRASNRNGCAELLNDIFKQNEADESLSPKMTKRLLYDLLGTLSKIEEVDIDEIEVGILSLLQDLPNVRAAKDELIRIFDEVCAAQNPPDKALFNIVEKAKDFIEQQRNNSSLTVELIAQNIPTNATYLSSLFKKTTGMGILEYITQLRMEEAKLLLVTTNETLDGVCAAVGYNSVRVFSRAFTKYVGVSPGKYRTLNFKQ